uniref:RNA helicase n=1 Tax=Scylla olivacea TaxID=85551 RepID=A0A0P4W405_SCYOL
MVIVENSRPNNMAGSSNNLSGGGLQCPLCSINNLSQQQFEEHKSSPQHRVKWLKHWYQNNKILLAQNKNGVEIITKGNLDGISTNHQTGQVVVYLPPSGQKVFQLVVKNTGQEPIILRQIEALHSCTSVVVSDNHGVCRGEKYVRVLGGVEYQVDCNTAARGLGVEQVPIAFQFKAETSDELFFIVRTVQVNVQDQVAEESGPTSVFKRPTPGQLLFISEDSIIPGVPLKKNQRPDGLSKKLPLNNYKYTKSLQLIAQKNFNPRKVTAELREEAKKISDMMKEGLTPQKYSMWYQTMLWLEEMQMELDIRYYSMEEAVLKQVPLRDYSSVPCVELRVPGLAENRPSVLKGDNVLVTHKGKKKPLYAGVVHEVKETSLYLAFGPEFMDTFIDNIRVSVNFQFNRHPLKVSHRALELIQRNPLNYLTFPSAPPAAACPITNIVPYNRKLENNREQMLAVRNIVNRTSRPAPYVVFGPPGTGKTVTIVEAIKQVLKLDPNSRILACTPSNSAADLIAVRLLEHVPSSQIFRMHATSRAISTIPDKLRDVSNVDRGIIYFPQDNTLWQYRIIVCTMVTAARVVSAGMPTGHITHVFLDESGHSMEPEALVPLSGLVSKDTQVVLAGDPHQLGPVIRNPQCFSSHSLFKNYGLDKSYLERVMEFPMYQPQPGRGFNTQVVTKLLNNYRSHSAILKEPNEIFYNSELKVCGDQMLIHSLCNWEHLPRRQFPLVFHAVKGKDDREGTSPSFFNAQEVSAVIGWVKKLLDSKSPRIAGKDVGVITPYRRQVEKIRSQLRKVRGAENVKVGSPEEFQGDERLVVIISTVRASQDYMADDHVFKLGFLRNPKRFNVAVTRAKALLIIVGCPEILSLDEHWGRLLRYIQQSGGYKGHAFTQNTDLDDIIARFNTLDLRPVLGQDVSAREMAEAPEWRAEH